MQSFSGSAWSDAISVPALRDLLTQELSLHHFKQLSDWPDVLESGVLDICNFHFNLAAEYSDYCAELRNEACPD